MNITAIDYIVLTVADMERTIAFYTQVLGMTLTTFGDNRKALCFGQQKFNLYQKRKRNPAQCPARQHRYD